MIGSVRGKGHGRGGYSVGRMLGEVKTAELNRLTRPSRISQPAAPGRG